MKRKIHNVQIITSIMSKETHLFEKKDDDEVRKIVEIKGTVERSQKKDSRKR